MKPFEDLIDAEVARAIERGVLRKRREAIEQQLRALLEEERRIAESPDDIDPDYFDAPVEPEQQS